MSAVITIIKTEPPLTERIKDLEVGLEKWGNFPLTKYSVGAWSPSKVKMLGKCPYQFYLNYILKASPDADYVHDTAMADVGTIAHRVLEHVIMGKGVDDAYAATKSEHCEVPPEALVKKDHANITKEKWEASIATLEHNIISFKERFENFERDNKIIAKHTELKLGVTKDWGKTTFFAKDVYFRGIIDLLIEIDTGEGYRPDMLLIDHKHGGAEFGRPSTRNYSQQLDSYKPMVHYGFKKFSGITTGIHFIKAGASAYDDYVDSDTVENKVKNEVEFIIGGAVDYVNELGFFKHVRGSHCVYCKFNDPCKAGVLKANELSTKKWFEIKQV